MYVHITYPRSVASLYQGSEVCSLTPDNTKRNVLAKNLFSVFTSHVIKTKNRNRSMNNVKNLEFDR